MSKVTQIIRMSVLIAIMVTLTFLCVIRLLQIQVVDADKWNDKIKDTFVATQTIEAIRGQIVDSEGRILNSNEIVYKVILQRAFLPFGQENEVIAGTLEILQKHEHEWIDNIPITMKAPFKFKNVSGEELDEFKRKLGLNYDATVENCIQALSENYKINTNQYNKQMLRYIGGIRYEMEARDFSHEHHYMFAEDISMDVLIELKEKAIVLKGVDVVEESMRVYYEGTVLPHVRGRINAINAEQYEQLKESGYSLNDVIGMFGLEESTESILRGEPGIREITRDAFGEVISDEITKPVNAGNTIKLTIDSEFQTMIEDILANQMNWISQRRNWPLASRPFTETTSGSIVVLDVTTGAILALATNPSYDLNDYVDMMLAEAAGDPPFPHRPLIDRSIGEGWRPGSSFKTVTGTSGLLNGVVGRSCTVSCGRLYTRVPGFRGECVTSGVYNVVNALYVSSNCYFYDVGHRLGIDRLSQTATDLFGIGTNLNIDTDMHPGRMTTPEVFEDLMERQMFVGDTLQASIGQSETLLTPLHMATVAMTIANKGVRYRPHLVQSVWNYDVTELVHETQPEIVADMRKGNEDTFTAVRDGMHQLGLKQGTGIFNHLPERPAYKTGTAEIIRPTHYNSTVLGFYPFEKPKIAFAVVLERSEYSSRAIRNIIDAYFYNHHAPVIDDNGNVLHDWTRWSDPFPVAVPGRYVS
jgi:penicillin-binding protein 2